MTGPHEKCSQPLLGAIVRACSALALLLPAPGAFAVAPTGERPIVRVRFERLSPVAQSAEAQKDVLLQMLRTVHVAGAVYLEWNDEDVGTSALDVPGRRLSVVCRTCRVPLPGETFLAEKLEVETPAGQKGSRLVRFAVGDSDDLGDARDRAASARWVVELAERRPRWVVRLLADARPGKTLDVSSARVEACWEGAACRGEATHAGEAEAFAFAEGLAGKETNRALPAGSPVGPRDVRAPVVVRMGDAVLVRVLTGASGLSIRARGRALQAGVVGDTVSVEIAGLGGSAAATPASRRTLSATVKGKGEVEYVLE